MTDWHGHEERIGQELQKFFEPKGYEVAFHRYSNIFDLIVAQLNKDSVNEIIGVEIKSDEDHIERLNKQLLSYIHIFDKIYIALENKKIPETIPSFIGIIRIHERVFIERKAKNLRSPTSTYITKSATRKTIEKSNGIKKRSEELILYLNKVDSVKRKLIYNTLFYDKALPFSADERIIINFIIGSPINELKESGIFNYEFGDVTIRIK